VKLADRIAVEPLDEERLTNIERRVVARAGEAAARGRAPRRLGPLAIAGAMVAAGLAGWALHAPAPSPVVAEPAPVRVDSPAGATLDLGDARITSDPDTAFEVRRPAGGVLIAMTRGKVALEVGKRGGRPPLIVRAGDTDVVVVGTRFTVDYDGRAEVGVRVSEGVVRVVHQQQETRVAAGYAWRTGHGLLADARPARASMAAAAGDVRATAEGVPAAAEDVPATAEDVRATAEDVRAAAGTPTSPTAGAPPPARMATTPTAGAPTTTARAATTPPAEGAPTTPARVATTLATAGAPTTPAGPAPTTPPRVATTLATAGAPMPPARAGTTPTAGATAPGVTATAGATIAALPPRTHGARGPSGGLAPRTGAVPEAAASATAAIRGSATSTPEPARRTATASARPATPDGELRAAIRGQRVEPALDLGEPDAARAVARYYDIAAHRSGDEASQAFYSIAVVRHLRLGRDAEALQTLDAYVRRFPGGKEYRAALWLRVRILCAQKIDDRCRAAAYTFVHEAGNDPAAPIAERITLSD
jgi:hypothetical protein